MKPRLIHSIGHALRGIRAVWREERSFRLELLIILVVIAGSFWMGLSEIEWVGIAIGSGMVLCAEIVNTIAEDILDLLHPDHHPIAGRVKDMGAALVLTSALSASAIALAIIASHLGL